MIWPWKENEGERQGREREMERKIECLGKVPATWTAPVDVKRLPVALNTITEGVNVKGETVLMNFDPGRRGGSSVPDLVHLWIG